MHLDLLICNRRELARDYLVGEGPDRVVPGAVAVAVGEDHAAGAVGVERRYAIGQHGDDVLTACIRNHRSLWRVDV